MAGWSHSIYHPLLPFLVHHLHVQIIQVIQICTPLSKFILGCVLLAAVLLVDRGKTYSLLHVLACTTEKISNQVATYKHRLSYFDHQIARWVSGHSSKFIRQLFECWTDILINHPAWKLKTRAIVCYIVLWTY